MHALRSLATLLLLPLTALGLASCALDAGSSDGVYLTGNGAPSGTHFNLNIIGVPKGKSADLSTNDGRRIFMPLEGRARINLAEGADFAVLDANGTDGSAAFQLPNPDPDGDG